jgi:putative hydrolase
MSDIPFGFGLNSPDDDGDDKPNLDPISALFGGAGAADLGAAMQQFGKMLSSSSGPVNWDLAKDTARQALSTDDDPSITPGERQSAIEAFRLADVWLDGSTPLPGATTKPSAWSRAEWIEQTLPQWRLLIQGLAERVAAAQGESLPQQLPEQMQGMAGPLMGVMQQMSGVMFGMQVGQGLGALAGEVLGSTDVGFPLAPVGVAALVPTNVAAFGDGLGVPLDEVRLYLAIRESAHLRLFHHAPWLRSRITAAVDDYARGISIDTSGMEAALSGVDPANPAALQELMQSGVFEPPTTPEQQAALDRLETLLALVEGWVDVVSFAAAEPQLPSAAALRETLQRRRGSGGPAEATFQTLVGLQLRPRRLREAAEFWRRLEDARGRDGRDALWTHPDLLPNAADLDDPVAAVAAIDTSEAPFDLSALDDAPPAPDEPSSPGEPSPS